MWEGRGWGGGKGERRKQQRKEDTKFEISSCTIIDIRGESKFLKHRTETTNNRNTPDLVVLGRAQLPVQVSYRMGRHAGESRQPQVGGQAQVGGAGDVGREGSEGVEVLRHLGGAGQGLRHGHRHR